MSKSQDPIRVQFCTRKNQDPICVLASGGRSLHRLSQIVYVDIPARPAMPGLARSFMALRVKPTRFQGYSSRAGTLEGSRLAKHKLPQTTTSTTTTYYLLLTTYYYYYYYYLLLLLLLLLLLPNLNLLPPGMH